MAGNGAITYHAFITHARADAGWAKWLHRRLESFDVRRALADSGVAPNEFPPSLRPVFRGQEKSPRAPELGYDGVAALYASAALIAICSPASGRSAYVSECVRLFKTRHPERLVIPVIVGGEPGGGSKECYPQALRYRLDRDEQFMAAPAGLLAVDLRPGRDSREGAIAKIAARMLGVPHYDLQYSGDSGGESHRHGRRSGLGAVIGLAFSAAVVAAVVTHREAINSVFDWKEQSRHEVEGLVQFLGAPKAGPLDAERAKDLLTAALRDIVDSARSERRYASAMEFLRQGKAPEAHAVLRKLAEEEAARGAPGARKAAEKYHGLGVIATLDNPEIAQEAFAKAAALEPDNPEMQRDLASAYGALAEHYVRTGERGMAALALREGKSAAERTIKLTPADSAARNDLAWFSRRLAEITGGEASGRK